LGVTELQRVNIDGGDMMSSRGKSPSRASRAGDAEDAASRLESAQFDAGILVRLPEAQLAEACLERAVLPWC
jgi:hypothetical protein